MTGEQGSLEASIARAKVRSSEIRVQLLAISDTARTEAQRELGAVDAKLSELGNRRLALEDRLTHTEIRPPVTGILHELKTYTVGGVITPADVLATVVPEDARLKIEIHIAPSSIDQVSVGRPARLRFTAFNQRTTPELKGGARLRLALDHEGGQGRRVLRGIRRARRRRVEPPRAGKAARTRHARRSPCRHRGKDRPVVPRETDP